MKREKFNHHLFFLCMLVLFLLFLSSHSIFAESDLNLKWEYSAENEISALEIADLDNDNSSEIIFVSGEKLYILDKEGKLKNNFTIKPENPKGKVYSLAIGELNNETNETASKEIVLGLSWIETIPVNRSYFNVTPQGIIEKKEEILYAKTINQGEIQIFSSNGKIIKSTKTEEWVKAISVADLNFDGSNEIITSGGGSNIFYYEEIYYGPEYVVGNETSTTTTFQESLTDNETTEGASKEFYEEQFFKSAIRIFDKNLTLISKKIYDSEVFSSSAISNLYNDLDLEILAISSYHGTSGTAVYPSGKLYCLTNNLTPLWEYSSSGDIRYLWVGDLQKDNIDEIIIGIIYSGFNSIEGITRDNKKFLGFRVPLGETIKEISVGDLDKNSENEIIIATDKNLYVFNLQGKEKFKNSILGIRLLAVGDLDVNNRREDIVFSIKNKVYAYSFSEKFLKKQEADSLYEKAEFFSVTNFSLSKEYAVKAIEIYKEINDSVGMKKSESLLLELNKKIYESKKFLADSLYVKSISFLAHEDYSKAKEYAESAKKIYQEINFSEGIESSDKQILKINELITITTTIAVIETTTTTQASIIFTTTTTLPPQEIQKQFNITYIIIFLITILITILYLRIKQRREEKREKEEFGE